MGHSTSTHTHTRTKPIRTFACDPWFRAVLSQNHGSPCTQEPNASVCWMVSSRSSTCIPVVVVAVCARTQPHIIVVRMSSLCMHPLAQHPVVEQLARQCRIHKNIPWKEVSV